MRASANKLYEIMEEIRVSSRNYGAPSDVPAKDIAGYLDWIESQFDIGKDLPELDLDMLRDVLTWARKSQEVKEPFQKVVWDQSIWLKATEDAINTSTLVPEGFCGTAGCIAGNIAIMQGEPDWQWEGVEEGVPYYTAAHMKDGSSIEEFAKTELGLTAVEADLLFKSENTLDDLERLAEGYAIRRGLTY